MEEKLLSAIGDVAATLLFTLSCHALETLSDDPIISDPKSVEITTDLNKILSHSTHPLTRAPVAGTLDRNLVVHIAIRAKK
jgi:O-methyltransferase involved in polyketide biosynthesis